MLLNAFWLKTIFRCITDEDDVVELMGAVDRDPDYYYERICGQQDTFNRTVNGNNFFILFTSYKGHVDDSKITMDRQFVGFHALYEFTNNTVSNAKRTTASGMKIILLDKCAVFSEVYSTISVVQHQINLLSYVY